MQSARCSRFGRFGRFCLEDPRVANLSSLIIFVRFQHTQMKHTNKIFPPIHMYVCLSEVGFHI